MQNEINIIMMLFVVDVGDGINFQMGFSQTVKKKMFIVQWTCCYDDGL